MQTHLRAHTSFCSGQEVSCAHPEFDRAKRVFDGPAAYAHCVRCLLQSLLHLFQDGFVLPAFHTALRAWGAVGFKGAIRDTEA